MRPAAAPDDIVPCDILELGDWDDDGEEATMSSMAVMSDGADDAEEDEEVASAVAVVVGFPFSSGLTMKNAGLTISGSSGTYCPCGVGGLNRNT